MAKCEVCGKTIQTGMKVSHSHIRTKRKWKPNLQRVRVVEGDRRRYSPPHPRLHPLPAFRQGPESNLTFTQTNSSLFGCCSFFSVRGLPSSIK